MSLSGRTNKQRQSPKHYHNYIWQFEKGDGGDVEKTTKEVGVTRRNVDTPKTKNRKAESLRRMRSIFQRRNNEEAEHEKKKAKRNAKKRNNNNNNSPNTSRLYQKLKQPIMKSKLNKSIDMEFKFDYDEEQHNNINNINHLEQQHGQLVSPIKRRSSQQPQSTLTVGQIVVYKKKKQN